MSELNESGCERLLIAVIEQARQDVRGSVWRYRSKADIAEAREFLAELEADCADLVKLRPPSHCSAQPEKTPGPAWVEDWRGPISRNVRSKAWRGMVRL